MKLKLINCKYRHLTLKDCANIFVNCKIKLIKLPILGELKQNSEACLTSITIL